MKLSTDFAFEGFRIMRNNPVSVLVWLVFFIILQVYSTYIVIGSGFFSEIQAMSQSGEPDIDEMMRLYANFFAAIAPIIPLSIFFMAVVYTSIFRASLFPKENKYAFMRVGMDELRFVLLNIINMFVYMLPIMLIILISSVIIGVVSVFNQPLVTALVTFIAIIAATIATVYFMTRMSLNYVQTLADKKLNIFGTWKLAEGKVGSLFLGYLLAIVLILVFVILASIVFFVIIAIMLGGDITQAVEKMQITSLEGQWYLDPFFIINILFNSIYALVSTVLLYGAGAGAYKELIKKDSF